MTSDSQLSVTQAAELIGISRQAVLKAISQDRLQAVKIGEQWVIERQAAEDYKERRQADKGES